MKCKTCNKNISNKQKKNRRPLTGLCITCFNATKKTVESKFCLDCEKQLNRYRPGQRCHACANKIMLSSRNQNGINNPNYIDGRTAINRQYPVDFKNKVEKIRERDDFLCQNKECNMTQEEHLIVYGSSLEVHHIDYNKYNNADENLLTLCKQCNVRANYNREYWQNLYTRVSCDRKA